MNKNLNVLQIIDSLNPGGAEMMAVNIANGLQEIGVNSHICATRMEGSLKNNIDSNVGYLFLNKKSSIDIKALLRLRIYVNKHQISIIHAHSSSFFVAILLKMVKPSVQIIWHDHYGNSELLPERKSFVLKICSYFFKSSIAVNELLLAWATKNIHSKNKTYLANFARLNTDLKQETVLKGIKGKRIVCLANLRPQKDHLNLLHGFSNLVKGYPDWTLHLIGADLNDFYSQEIKGFIEHNDLQKAVFLYGNCNDTLNVLQQATIGVLSSKSEGLPVSLLEYGLVGIPVVATEVGDINKVVIPQQTGILIPPSNSVALKNALEYFINNGIEAQELGNSLYKFVTLNFSRENYLNELVKIYQFA
ncbi:glycosyltransferase [Lutibacter sp.]|uniref:glycosyltransferase n=1 Tax=Lutibacter sp. TaxID=1925666 RepID=UPI003566FD46